jgi:hypothetical protein
MRPGDTTSPERKETTAEMMADIVRLRRDRVEFADIGAQMAAKYRTEAPDQPYVKQWMHELYVRALKEIPANEVNEYRAEQLDLLDELMREALAIMRRDHLSVSQGRVVRLGQPIIVDGEAVIAEGAGEPVLDDGPRLSAITELRKLLERMAKIVGSDSPVKVEQTGSTTVNYLINGVDVGKMT